MNKKELQTPKKDRKTQICSNLNEYEQIQTLNIKNN